MNFLRLKDNDSLSVAIASLLACLIFLWLILRHSLTVALSENYPEISSFLNSTSASPIIKLAQREVTSALVGREEAPTPTNDGNSEVIIKSNKDQQSNSPSANNLMKLRSGLISVIRNEPINAKAFRLLGQLASLSDDQKTASRMMYQSTQLSLHDPIALYELLKSSMSSHKYAAAIYYADAFLRGFPTSDKLIAPILMEIMSTDQARPLLVKTLAENPPWRLALLNSSYAQSGLRDIQAPLKLLEALKDAGSPPQLKELVSYLKYLFENKEYDLAYSTWLLFMPEELMDQTGMIFNGSFEVDPTGLIFDWTIGAGKEVEVGISSRPDDESNRALYVEFGMGRTQFPLVQEIILLTPGNYELSFLVKGQLTARRGLEWRIVCENGKKIEVSQTILGRYQGWRRITSNIDIPKEGCRFQYIRLVHLARSASEQMAEGSLWFDDVTIQRKNEARNFSQ